jgi:Putative adhesin Stv domain
MGIVAIPPGTTLQFYSDAGQTLRFGDLKSMLPQLQAPWPTLTSSDVTYNLTLRAFAGIAKYERFTTAVFASDHLPHLPGVDLEDPTQLCTGTVGQCPTDPREQRAHTCHGLLARYTGELHWIACTNFRLPRDEEERAIVGMTEDEATEAREVIDAARGDTPPSVFLNSDPDSWDQHTSNLLVTAKEYLKVHRELGTPEKFVAYFDGVTFNDEERDALLTDPEIAEIVDNYR